MLGLRVSEACQRPNQDLRYAGGYELPRVLGKGAKPDEIPLPIPAPRAVKAATEGRTGTAVLRAPTPGSAVPAAQCCRVDGLISGSVDAACSAPLRWSARADTAQIGRSQADAWGGDTTPRGQYASEIVAGMPCVGSDNSRTAESRSGWWGSA